MKWTKRHAGTIENIVTEQTKMSVEMLLNDKHIYVYPNLKQAEELYLKHIAAGSKIAIYGDYDTDGVVSLTEFNLTNRALKFTNVKLFAPRRFSDGYGININRIEQFISEGYNLILTVDNGIAAIDEIKKARDAGLDVIILDHHEPKETLPEANVICDPHVTGGDDTYNFDDLCGAGLTLHFCLDILNHFNHISDESKDELISQLYSIAAIATVADLVKLSFDNRAIVKRGLKEINAHKGTYGLNKLLEILNVQSVTSSTIAFNIAPVINASGRLYDDGAKKMVELLSFNSDNDALANLCEDAKEANDTRKDKTKSSEEEAIKTLDGVVTKDTTVVVFKDTSKLPGIAGLIASKLVEKYKRPCIVVTEVTLPDGSTILKGSGRTFGDINILNSVSLSSEYLISFGGHKEALGLALKEENFNAFCKAINDVTPRCDVSDELFYDIKMTPSKALWGIVKEIEKFEPYGTGNVKPTILLSDISLGDKVGNTAKYMGKNNEHVKLLNENVNVLMFSGASYYDSLGKPKKISAVGDLSINVFNGKRSLQLQAIDIK